MTAVTPELLYRALALLGEIMEVRNGNLTQQI